MKKPVKTPTLPALKRKHREAVLLYLTARASFETVKAERDRRRKAECPPLPERGAPKAKAVAMIEAYCEVECQIESDLGYWLFSDAKMTAEDVMVEAARDLVRALPVYARYAKQLEPFWETWDSGQLKYHLTLRERLIDLCARLRA